MRYRELYCDLIVGIKDLKESEIPWGNVKRLYQEIITWNKLGVLQEEFSDNDINEFINDGLKDYGTYNIDPTKMYYHLIIEGDILLTGELSIKLYLIKAPGAWGRKTQNKNSLGIEKAHIVFDNYNSSISFITHLKLVFSGKYKISLNNKVTETSTAGGSCAGGIATAVSGLGAGDPKASIYYSKKKTKKSNKLPIIKR